MAHQPLKFIFYIAATPEKVPEGFLSQESIRPLFSGAELPSDFKPGGWSSCAHPVLSHS